MSTSKLNFHGRPAMQTTASSSLFCVNLTWTLALLYLTWSMFLSHDSISSRGPNNDQSLQHDISGMTADGSYSRLIQREGTAKTIKTMNGRLKDNTIIYRQSPSPEVDQAWNEAAGGHTATFNVTAAELRRIGIDPATVVAWDEDGDAYPASFEYTHLIHCLDMIRKEMFHEHYFPAVANQDPGPEQMRRDHAMHCVHMLLQDLTCHVDLDLVPSVWMPYTLGRAGMRYAPTGMFSITKTCRDIDAVNRWLRENHVPNDIALLGALKPPPNAKLYVDDGYWAGR